MFIYQYHIFVFVKGGVHNLHGLPGIISGIASAIAAALASQDLYGDR